MDFNILINNCSNCDKNIFAMDKIVLTSKYNIRQENFPYIECKYENNAVPIFTHSSIFYQISLQKHETKYSVQYFPIISNFHHSHSPFLRTTRISQLRPFSPIKPRDFFPRPKPYVHHDTQSHSTGNIFRFRGKAGKGGKSRLEMISMDAPFEARCPEAFHGHAQKRDLSHLVRMSVYFPHNASIRRQTTPRLCSLHQTRLHFTSRASAFRAFRVCKLRRAITFYDIAKQSSGLFHGRQYLAAADLQS